jgi:glycosyltransferase involved in cell wall biosynthesis
MISVIVAVMNREKRLKETLENWLKYDWFDEIIVVDWSSDVPFSYDHPMVKVYRVDNEPTWILTHAYNLAASLATGDILVKMDSDYQIDDRFSKIFPIPEGSYYHGTWFGEWSLLKTVKEYYKIQLEYYKLAQYWNQVHRREGKPLVPEVEPKPPKCSKVDNENQYLSGFFAAHKKDFDAVNGYNEKIVTYGFDDSDLYIRLDKVATPLLIGPKVGIWHEPHDAKLRSANQNIYDIMVSQKENMELSKASQWSQKDQRSEWLVKGNTCKRNRNLKFIYLIMSETDQLTYDIPKNSDYMILKWSDGPAENPNAFQFTSTFAEGRNELLRRAREKGDYDYFVYMDDDVIFINFSLASFEESIRSYEGPIPYAFPYLEEHNFYDSIDVDSFIKYADHPLMALRNDVALEMPYSLEFCKTCWWRSTTEWNERYFDKFGLTGLCLSKLKIQNGKHRETYPTETKGQKYNQVIYPLNLS